jgi:hypothetical protein
VDGWSTWSNLAKFHFILIRVLYQVIFKKNTFLSNCRTLYNVIISVSNAGNTKTGFPVFGTLDFLAASTECSAGSNDHFVVGVGAVPSLVQFDGRPLH